MLYLIFRNHSMEKTEKVEATCTMPGKEAYYTCNNCGKHFSDENGQNEINNLADYGVIDATGHNYGEWVETKPATATEAGSREKVCSVCGDKVVEAIPVTPDIPQTGDTSNMDIYGLLLLLSGVGVVGGVVYNSRKVCSK